MNDQLETRPERLLTLDEIILLTGHRSTTSAYSLLRKHKAKPDGKRRAARAPKAVWRESVVREVFAKHLESARRVRMTPEEDML